MQIHIKVKWKFTYACIHAKLNRIQCAKYWHCSFLSRTVHKLDSTLLEQAINPTHSLLTAGANSTLLFQTKIRAAFEIYKFNSSGEETPILGNGHSCRILLSNIYFRNKDLLQSCQDKLLPAYWLEFQDDKTTIQVNYFKSASHQWAISF